MTTHHQPVYYTDTYITISRLSLYAHHGVLEQERQVGNEFLVDAILHYDAVTALDSDDVRHALNYAEVIDIIKRVMKIPCNLIEHVTANIIQALLTDLPMLTHGSITITKVKPPVSAQLAGASFTIDFSRS